MTGAQRAIRGGNFDNDAQRARSAYRNDRDPSNRNPNQGFRLVRLPAPQPDVTRSAGVTRRSRSPEQAHPQRRPTGRPSPPARSGRHLRVPNVRTGLSHDP